MPRLLLLGILVAAPGAFAATLPTIAVVGVHDEDRTPDEQQRLADAMVRTIDSSDFFEARTPLQVQTSLAGREEFVLEDAFLGPGVGLLEDGKTLYGQANPEEAAIVLQDAVDTLRLGMSIATSTRELWDALVYLGAAQLTAGDGRAARTAFEAAVAINPLRSPDSARFPPTILERYETVRRERVALSSTLYVDADERGTVIWVNGIERGEVPVMVDEITPGENYIVARSPRGFSAYRAVSIPEAGTERVSLRLGEPSLGTPAAGPFARSRQVGSLYRAVAEHAASDLILIAGRDDDGNVALQLYNPRIDGFSAVVTRPVSGALDDEALAAMEDLLIGVRDDGTFLPDHRAPLAAPVDVGTNNMLARMLIKPVERRVIGPDGEPKKRGQWLAWTAVGVGSAAAIGGAAYGMSVLLTNPHQGTIVVLPPE